MLNKCTLSALKKRKENVTDNKNKKVTDNKKILNEMSIYTIDANQTRSTINIRIY